MGTGGRTCEGGGDCEAGENSQRSADAVLYTPLYTVLTKISLIVSRHVQGCPTHRIRNPL